MKSGVSSVVTKTRRREEFLNWPRKRRSRRLRFFQLIQLATGIGGKRRVGKFFNQAIERLLCVALFAGVRVHTTEAKQDAVDRHIAVLPLRELLERVNRLLVLSGLRLGLREPEPRHLTIQTVSGALDDLLIRRLSAGRLAERHVCCRLTIARENPGVCRGILVRGDFEFRERRLILGTRGIKAQSRGGRRPRGGRSSHASFIDRERIRRKRVRASRDVTRPRVVADQGRDDGGNTDG